MNLKNILITNKELGLQKNHEISLIKSGKKKYIGVINPLKPLSRKNKLKPTEYRVCWECLEILHFSKFGPRSKGWPDLNGNRHKPHCLHCDGVLQKRRHEAIPHHRLYLLAQRRAKRDKLPFDLTSDYIKSIWPKDNKCPILGTTFKFGIKNKHELATIDKMNPKKGYVKGNVVIISFRANQLKRDIEDIEIFNKLYQFYKKYKD